MMDKTYDFSSVEKKSSAKWDSIEAFRMGANASLNAESFCIVMPPPNVTGSLHMGHAFNSTLQDIMIRFERMRGKNVLWQSGTDHAGIATQVVVERDLLNNYSITKKELGREDFIKKIWNWKSKSGGSIISQLKRLGASCDWSRERFTMDKGMSDAVMHAFVSLYKQGLIYKDKRIVNWDPHLETSVSDLEVIQNEVEGNLWYIRYQLADGISYRHPTEFNDESKPINWEIRDYIIIATTRPETMFGDTGIAVHPDDCRYQELIGKHAVLPIIGRKLKIVSDNYPDPSFGAGAVKLTPAHDFNDFEIAKRAGLDFIDVLNSQSKLSLLNNENFLRDIFISDEIKNVLCEFESLNCSIAREKIVALLEHHGFINKIVSYKHVVPYCERSGVPVEPRITDQWYLNVKVLAEPAISSVENSLTSFIPKSWDKSYYEWMKNIQPWCISRQIWWGHQIPAWYGPDGKFFVENNECAALDSAIKHYIAEGGEMAAHVRNLTKNGNISALLKRDDDVLDTWFSSALWPFASLGWPEKTVELKTYYPTNILVTGFDILFFWVARMMMMGMNFMKDSDNKGIEPFNYVYMHALVRDKHGQKMSKSKGNIIDPIDLIDQYGADALRFYFAVMAVQGRDIKLDLSRVVGYRNFITKFWNAVRFSQINNAKHSDDFNPQNVSFVINKWIISRLSIVIKEVTSGIEDRRFNDVSAVLYRFVWNELCDWYVEFIKPIINQRNDKLTLETLSCFSYVLHNVCKLLHPIIPFVTEEIYSNIIVDGMNDKAVLCHAKWPSMVFDDTESVEEVDFIIRLISEIRSVRKSMNVPLKAVIPLVFIDTTPVIKERLLSHQAVINSLSSGNIVFAESFPSSSVQIVLDEVVFFLHIGDFIDFHLERSRIEKSIEKVSNELLSIKARLANSNFLEKAHPSILQLEREKLDKAEKKKTSLDISLARIKVF
ncbi:valine--tRNA ligase [Candidatus Liberibacter americanus]|uniref:Valine--tRNA ligase n=1 Tax=Candidatus Liberibacter americanus str. Sao Paulo TaxID=1261131 RepID=U6B402_9HYPH|nr:valine--tRNA ligase [Candidatus Liberibacter americanus]AHA27784.1 Valyl-tRNA synthetase [Candidatus Liberibacter americanus str. Sao Paulo]EMS36169.1 valyl-tRNA synthetase [Candidatus Liberibacter americanus PW_SP]